MNSILDNAVGQIRESGQRLHLSELAIEQLIAPAGVVHFRLPLEKDDGSVEIYDAYRSQHSDKLGPFKGGLRFHPQVDAEEVQGLSTLMSIKTAVAGIPMGGGKGGVAVNPKDLSEAELERLTRAFGAKLAPYIGPKRDVPAPDVNTNGKIMGWLLDEYEQFAGEDAPATYTGKAVESGGSEGREDATGRGGVIVTAQLLESMNLGDNPTVAIQGFGNVGSWFARLGEQRGWKIIAVSDSSATVHDINGLNAAELADQKANGGSLKDIAGSELKVTDRDEVFSVDCDILVLAALENSVTKDNVNDIKATLVVEMANNPITAEAYDTLVKRGVQVAPDVLANAGGVIVSYYEWQQNLSGDEWTTKDVAKKLEDQLHQAATQVIDRATDANLNFKDAAFDVAIKKLV